MGAQGSETGLLGATCSFQGHRVFFVVDEVPPRSAVQGAGSKWFTFCSRQDTYQIHPVHPGSAKQVTEPAILSLERRGDRVQTCDKRQTLVVWAEITKGGDYPAFYTSSDSESSVLALRAMAPAGRIRHLRRTLAPPRTRVSPFCRGDLWVRFLASLLCLFCDDCAGASRWFVAEKSRSRWLGRRDVVAELACGTQAAGWKADLPRDCGGSGQVRPICTTSFV